MTPITSDKIIFGVSDCSTLTNIQFTDYWKYISTLCIISTIKTQALIRSIPNLYSHCSYTRAFTTWPWIDSPLWWLLRLLTHFLVTVIVNSNRKHSLKISSTKKHSFHLYLFYHPTHTKYFVLVWIWKFNGTMRGSTIPINRPLPWWNSQRDNPTHHPSRTISTQNT